MVDGLHATFVHTAETLGADAAGQTAGGFSLCLFRGVAGLYLGKAPQPFIHWQFRHGHTWSNLNFTKSHPVV